MKIGQEGLERRDFLSTLILPGCFGVNISTQPVQYFEITIFDLIRRGERIGYLTDIFSYISKKKVLRYSHLENSCGQINPPPRIVKKSYRGKSYRVKCCLY